MSFMELFSKKYGITVAVFGLHGRPCVRISASVYNSMEDYEKLRDAVLDMIREGSGK